MSEIFLKMCSSVTICWLDTFPHFLFFILDRSDREFLMCILYSVTLIYLLDIVLTFCYPDYCSYRSWPTSDPINLSILFIPISFWIIKFLEIVYFSFDLSHPIILIAKTVGLCFDIFFYVYNLLVVYMSPFHYLYFWHLNNIEFSSSRKYYSSIDFA